MQRNRALVERYRGKRYVLVAHSLGTGSTLVVLEWLASRGRLREVNAAQMPGTQLALPGRRLHVLHGPMLHRFVILDNDEEIGQCQRYSSRPASGSD
ncbi:hypothetical protein [Burkholderia ambifaria]|uniref:hypothetical protein n=1 Tax=Burkholderia ambifaria TaxID=152480 RepID=UPI00158AB4DA|nr:hypothetical protein [Burkholderia ambifaria]